jgi:ankyrin repeat protein
MLHVACNLIDNTSSIVKNFLDAGLHANVKNDHDQTPLHFAAERLNYGMISVLIQHGADVNLRDKNGDTPITLLMQSGFGELYMKHSVTKLIESHKCIKLLCDHGANINDIGCFGATPLFMAVHGLSSGCNVRETYQLITILTGLGANPNIGLMIGNDDSYEDCYCVGDTPLHVAVKLKNLKVVKLLLTFYPNINRVNSRNMSVLDYARTYNVTTIRNEIIAYKKIELKCHRDNPHLL